MSRLNHRWPFPARSSQTLPSRHRFCLAIVALGIAVLTSGNGAGAQCATTSQSQKLLEPSSGPRRFGGQVAIGGNTLAAANYTRASPGAADGGRVSVFTRADELSPWIPTAVLAPTGGGAAEPGDYGVALAVEASTLVVGSSQENAVYIYTGGGSAWLLQQKLVPGGFLQGQPVRSFGNAVDLSGNYLVVGDQLGGAGSNQGYAAVYVRSGSTWSLQQVLLPPQDEPSRFFGQSVQIQGTTMAVARAIRGASPFYDFGEVSIFTRLGTVWTPQDEISPLVQTNPDNFGASMSLAGDTLLVGAPGYTVLPPETLSFAGAAYIFTRTGSSWTQRALLQRPSPDDGDMFGRSVSLASEQFAAVGASGADFARGEIRTYQDSGAAWQLKDVIIRSANNPYDEFGISLAAQGLGTQRTIVGGAIDADPPPGMTIGAGSVYSFTVTPPGWVQDQKLQEPAGTSAFLGSSLALAGDYAVVGAEGDDVLGNDAGAAHVLYNTGVGGWQHVTTLYGANADSLAGYSVDISDDATTIAVGIPYDGSSNIGHVYLYTRSGSGLNSTWTFRQALQSSDGATSDHFGSSVDLLGDLLLVGAPEDNNTEGTDAGAVYVYTRSGNTWGSEVKLAPFELVAGDQFGVSTKLMTSTRMAVGAYGDDTGLFVNSGAVYIIDLQPIIGGQAWTVTEVLIPADVATGDNFGYKLATSSNNLVIVGSPLDDNAGGVDAGSAYIFRATGIPGTLPNNWSQQARLAAAVGGTNERFGYSVAYDNGTIVVGMPLDDNAGGADAGAAFVFRQASGVWTEQFRFGAADRTAGDQLGLSVAIDGDFIACGAPFEDNDTGVDAGAVYFFDYSIAPPVITANPSPVTACTGTAEVYFGLIASGGPLTYRWYRNNVPMNDVPGHISGSFTSALTITGPVPADAGLYKCQAVNPCGFTFTNEALFTVCPADFNCSGTMSVQDIFDFLGAYFTASSRADFNLSGSITVQDIFDFLAAYFAGC